MLVRTVPSLLLCPVADGLWYTGHNCNRLHVCGYRLSLFDKTWFTSIGKSGASL